MDRIFAFCARNREYASEQEGQPERCSSMEATRPTLQQVAMVVREAELWLARFRLMRAGKLRLVRWHAIGRANAPPLFVPGPHD